MSENLTNQIASYLQTTLTCVRRLQIHQSP